jgi:hypothetical protein
VYDEVFVLFLLHFSQAFNGTVKVESSLDCDSQVCKGDNKLQGNVIPDIS